MEAGPTPQSALQHDVTAGGVSSGHPCWPLANRLPAKRRALKSISHAAPCRLGGGWASPKVWAPRPAPPGAGALAIPYLYVLAYVTSCTR